MMTSLPPTRITRPLARLILLVAVAVGYTLPALAVETKVLRDDSFSDFNKGVSTGTEVLAEGRLQIGPRAELLEKSSEGVVWDIVVNPADDSVYYATGHSGKVFRLQAGGKPELWADLTEVEATALAIDAQGALLIGASPGGKIYRVAEKRNPKVFFETGEKYVWDLLVDKNGELYAATGTSGKIYHIRSERSGEVYYDSDATNVMALAFDQEETLLAATQGKAYVLRVQDAKHAYVMYAATQDELRSIALDSAGNVYAAANSARTSSVFDKATTGSSQFGGSLSGQGVIVQIHPNGFVNALWSAPEGPIHQIIADNETSSILVAAGKNGKIYRVNTADSNYSVVTDVDQSMVTALARGTTGVLLGTANKAAIYQLETSAPLVSGLFASRALDADSTVRWGNLTFDGEVTSGTPLSWETRSGNTAAPTDGTWSPWIAAPAVADRIHKVNSPIAQYLQYRITFAGATSKTTSFVDGVRVYFVQKNVPPVIKKIELDKVPGSPGAAQAAALASAVARMQQSATSSGGEDKAKQASDEAAKAATAAARAAQAAVTANVAKAGGDLQNSQKVNITWTAADPNNDKLRYNLYYKGEDEKMWKLIDDNITATKHQFSTEAIPDGEYRFKLEATDRFENQETSASTVSMISRIYTVDNSPPDITDIKATAQGDGSYEITAKASDKTSILSAVEYNLDAADEWMTLAPVDGIFDFQQEDLRFRVTPEKSQPEHSLSIRVYDHEGNSRVEKILLK